MASEVPDRDEGVKTRGLTPEEAVARTDAAALGLPSEEDIEAEVLPQIKAEVLKKFLLRI